MGITHIVLAVNKMDLINFNQKKYLNIVKTFHEFTKIYNFENIQPIPISALTGDNILKRNTVDLKWYNGPSIIEFLENVRTTESTKLHDFTMPVQWVNRSGLDFRGYAGLITSGSVSTGDNVQIHPKGTTNKIKKSYL